jgi:hypothetical protein
VSILRAAIVLIALAGPLCAASPGKPRSVPRIDFFAALDLKPPAPAARDVWQLTPPATDPFAPMPWMTDTGPIPVETGLPDIPVAAFQAILDRIADDGPRWSMSGNRSEKLHFDPDRLRYQMEKTDDLHYRRLRLEVPDAELRSLPYGARDWKAEDKYRVPVPIPIPTAEQLFVYGQVNGSGDSLNTLSTTLTGKTGLGVKWALIGKSELQVRSGALFSYSEATGWSRNPDRAKPAFEVVATVPLPGPWSLEYTGSALPAVSREDPDQIRQELRFALPLRNDGEFEFGARYQWLDTPQLTPWVDRAQLFLGVKFRH